MGNGAVWRHGPHGAMQGRVCNNSGLPRCGSGAALRCTVIGSGGGNRYAVWLTRREVPGVAGWQCAVGGNSVQAGGTSPDHYEAKKKRLERPSGQSPQCRNENAHGDGGCTSLWGTRPVAVFLPKRGGVSQNFGNAFRGARHVQYSMLSACAAGGGSPRAWRACHLPT